MNNLELHEFPTFFQELWEHSPFPWQTRLAQRVFEEGWPAYIDLPTASGKTACLDVAVFALAMQAAMEPEERTIGRRIFFVVNRRVIVDEAYERAKRLAKALMTAAPGSMLGLVAQGLRRLSGDEHAPPLDVALLRGGIVRDNRWARSITQPTIVTSTVDQVGSRLLFRGYGVSDAAKPLHAALVAHDSLLLLDEAHISQPFMETLESVRQYRDQPWAHETIRTPFAFVRMTATPGDTDSETFGLEEEDRQHPVLSNRHGKAKPTALREASKAKGKGLKPHEELAKVLVEEAVGLMGTDRRNIAIVVNRIATARVVAKQLPEVLRKKKQPEREVHLAIGRMRPIDRDQLTEAIQHRVGPERETPAEAPPMFVVATQCLEVGADFDFDAMVSECASLDALRQRFGRLNRRGRDIETRAAVVVRADQADKHDDPIYGEALTATWKWLKEHAPDDESTVDFGIQAMDDLLHTEDTNDLLAPRLNAPVMFPAYVDMWAQTHPIPTPDPDVALFLHGPQRGEPDVQVCWRRDLEEGAEEDWVQIVSLCPPSSPECMSVPIGVVRRWLEGRDVTDEARSDCFDGQTPEDGDSASEKTRDAVIWRGAVESARVKSARDLRPGDTVVLPVTAGGWDVFGHMPQRAQPDMAEAAYHLSSGSTVLRLRPKDLEAWPEAEAVDELRDWLRDPEISLRADTIRALLRKAADNAPEAEPERAEAMRKLGNNSYGFEYER